MASPSGKGSGTTSGKSRSSGVLWTSSCSPLTISKRDKAGLPCPGDDSELLNLLGDENETLFRTRPLCPLKVGTAEPLATAGTTISSGDSSGVKESKNSNNGSQGEGKTTSTSITASAPTPRPAPSSLIIASSSSSSSSSTTPASLRAWGPSFGMKEPSGYASLLLTSTGNRTSFSTSVVPLPSTSASTTPGSAAAAAIEAATGAVGQSPSLWCSLHGSPTFGDGRQQQRMKRAPSEELEDAANELTKRLRLESGASARLRQGMLDSLRGPTALTGEGLRGSTDASRTSSD
ncbi:Hypothetical protein NocV09_00700970 [Nannochloropsis oceanica]